MRILRYFPAPAEFRPYQPQAAEAARRICGAIHRVAPELQVEHIGSTAVPDCGGKGIIDLAVLYRDGCLVPARAVLDGLGFQKQTGPEPFPESRPMRVGSVEHDGHAFRIHAHVVAFGSDEHRQLVWFRDALRASPELRHRYEERKRAILALGINDSHEYCKAKGIFITDALKAQTT
jgi:GrpB-like predicted nucleotidyltransferase (UPF0157 family)